MKKIVFILSITIISVVVFSTSVEVNQSTSSTLLEINKLALAHAETEGNKVCCESDPGDNCKVGNVEVHNYDEYTCK